MRKKWALMLFPFFIQSTETDGFYFMSFENYCIDQSEVWVNDQWLVKDKNSQSNFCNHQYFRSSSNQSHDNQTESNNK